MARSPDALVLRLLLHAYQAHLEFMLQNNFWNL